MKNAKSFARNSGYTSGVPFLVVSDAFPAGFLPRPCVPLAQLGLDLEKLEKRKQIKARVWVPLESLVNSLPEWGSAARTDKELCEINGFERKGVLHQHNSLNRLTMTTGKGAGFAPFSMQMHWYGETTSLDVYLLLDETRIGMEEIRIALVDVGTIGYGKEASTGAGRFDVLECTKWQPPTSANASNALLTLGPCAPQGGNWNTERCWYRTFVRFGRHGDVGVHGNAFKNPVLLADTAAIMTPADGSLPLWIGRGLGGVSHNLPATVQQGYAPVFPVQLGEQEAA
ncbi:MAG: CRISPR-associated protein Csm4 [Pseudomonadales bacterium]|jgi:CRISPR-associated protein Csm4|nr:CRISPR-associated protein Csm4 [Pseudomonadales bacterium]MCP5338391.1 CRISPR-associated protein Csm4 [Pseudomonadales bacterium]